MSYWPQLLLTIFVLGLPIVSNGSSLVIESANLVRQRGELQLDAEINYQLSPAAVEALDNGVPLIFRLDFTLQVAGSSLWELPLINHSDAYRLAYHALTARYLVTHIRSGSQHVYNSLQLALGALGSVRNLVLPTINSPERGERYQAAMRTRLDLEELPAPLRLVAYFTPAWHLESGWYRWSVSL